MANNVYKMVELVGTSPKSIEDAVNNALASKPIKKAARWLQVVETRGAIKDGKVAEWQVTMKVGLKEE
ncbi:MAG: dodecin [Phycisphaerae bacterium]